jgi:hypothetical protein
MANYRKRINGRKVWWVRVNYKGLNASRVCESKEAAKTRNPRSARACAARSSTRSRLGSSPGSSRREIASDALMISTHLN